MVQINFAQKTVNAKIVYYGPGMSGKTTNLEIVHQRAPDQNRGELTSISTDGDRTLFFDFMPLDLGTVAGMRTSFQIYTVPGQVYYNSTRKLVLQGVDGVVFVADSSASMVDENLESLHNLEENLNEYGKSLATLPHVIQFNKRDLPDALPTEEINAQLNRHGCTVFEAVANTGQGVFPTLKSLAATVLESIHSGSGGGSVPAPRQAAPQQAAPQQAMPQQAMPQQAMPQQAMPQQAMPQQAMPQQAMPAQPVQPAPVAPPPPQVPQQPAYPAPVAAQAQPAAHPMAQTAFQPPPTQPQPVAAPHQPLPVAQQQAPAVQQVPVQQQPAMAQPQMDPGSSLQMAAPPEVAQASQPGSGHLMANAPQAQPTASAKKSLEQSRFRPRPARQEPRPTPVARTGGNKLYTGIFVILALAVGGVLTRVVLSFF